MDPTDVILPIDFSPGTLQSIVDLLQVSTRFEHFVYREMELDEVWRLVEAAHKYETDQKQITRLRRLLDVVAEAHDLVGEGQADEAARRLRDVL